MSLTHKFDVQIKLKENRTSLSEKWCKILPQLFN